MENKVKVTVCPMGDSTRGGGYKLIKRRMRKERQKAKLESKGLYKKRGGRGRHNCAPMPQAMIDMINDYRRMFQPWRELIRPSRKYHHDDEGR